MLYEHSLAIKIVAFSSSLLAKNKQTKRQTNSAENCIDKLQSFYSERKKTERKKNKPKILITAQIFFVQLNAPGNDKVPI